MALEGDPDLLGARVGMRGIPGARSHRDTRDGHPFGLRVLGKEQLFGNDAGIGETRNVCRAYEFQGCLRCRA